jgi:hypothetical protein
VRDVLLGDVLVLTREGGVPGGSVGMSVPSLITRA